MNDMPEASPPHLVLDDALRAWGQGAEEPADAGFSLQVMARLPPHVPARRVRWVRWMRRVQGGALALAACGAAWQLAEPGVSLAAPSGWAAMALTGLVIFWAVPSRWSRG